MRARATFLVLAILAAGGLIAYGPIPQPPGLQVMADRRMMFGVPNAFDVVSNAAFIVVGAMGIAAVIGRPGGTARWARWPYGVLFLMTVCTAFGSAYYHLAPDNDRLVWDRLPMAIGFMALVTAVVADRIDSRIARALFVPLLAAGAGSVFYWQATELHGAGDLRPYLCVQFGSIAAIAYILLSSREHDDAWRYLILALGLYAVAKGFEMADGPVFALGHLVSGHTLKHLAAAAAVAAVIQSWRVRLPSASKEPSVCASTADSSAA